MTGMGDSDSRATAPAARRRGWLAVAIIAVVLVVAGALAATYFANAAGNTSAEPTPTPTVESSATPTPSATPSATPTPAPTASGAQPTDCYEIYGQDFLDTTGTEVLNDPGVVSTDISRYRPIEEIRETLPGIECHWGLATEGGVANAVNTVSPEQQQQVITLLGENEHVCADENGGTICRQSATFDDEGSAWTLAEEHFFREGLWVSTWWAGTASSIGEVTGPMYETIWG